MNPIERLQRRLGNEATSRFERFLAPYPDGDDFFSPAPIDRCRGAMAGTLIGELLPATLQGTYPGHAPNTRMGLIAGDALMADPQAHPKSFAESLFSADVSGTGAATIRTQASLRSGEVWWKAGVSNSAGAAAAARASAFGLLFANDPPRAAYEAALCAAVTHQHGAAITGAAAVAAAVAFASQFDGPLARDWLHLVANICEQFPQEEIYGETVVGSIRHAAAALDGYVTQPSRVFPRTALCTHAIPAALLVAASAPSPYGLSPSHRSASVLRALCSLHEAGRAIAGACIGARGGRSVWETIGSEIGYARGGWVRTPGLADSLALADRIAGQGGRDPEEAPPTDESSEERAAVHVSFLIDRSGSMTGMEEEVVSGFNDFVNQQRAHEGICSMTLVMFDDVDLREVVHEDVPIGSIPEMAPEQFQPRGATPLLDAMGEMIKSAERRCKRLGRGPADEDQIVVVFTDGMENASVRWNRRQLFDLVSARREAGWTFVFLGANQDSYQEAGRLGIGAGSIQDYRGDQQGVRTAFESVNRAMGQYRRSGRSERIRRRQAFFDGRKEAEDDHNNRR